ncbi:MAG: hypothetical protein ACW9W9_06195 [Candidatus Nitrosopumilus sp. Bin_571-38]|jgi:hypothetical protein
MSENKDFEILDKLNNKYFTELETSVPHIQQTLFDLQNEFYKTWRNAITANTTLYKEFLNNSGSAFPKSAQDLVENVSEEALKFRSIYNKLAISNIESIKNTSKTWNDNAETFVDLNRKIMHYWLSVFSSKKN